MRHTTTKGTSMKATLAVLATTLGAVAFAATPALAEECPNAAYRTGPSANLPDCRAYELVSPPLKNNGWSRVNGLSPDGSSALLDLVGGSGVPGAEGQEGLDSYRPVGWISVKRTDTGWTYMADNPPTSEYTAVGSEFAFAGNSGFEEEGQSANDQTTVWKERAQYRSANSAGLYLRRPDHSMVEVGPIVPPTTPLLETVPLAAAAKPEVVGVSADASHVLYTLREYYWPSDGTSAGDQSLYEYVGTGNTAPMLVGIDNHGEQIGRCGDELGDRGENGSIHNALSEDGSTVFFTVLPKTGGCESAPPVSELYARIDNGLPDARTVAISQPSEEDCSACYAGGVLTSAGDLQNADFQGASEDGSKVFFQTSQPLLPGAVGVNLYEFDLDAPAGERIVRVSLSAGDPRLLPYTPTIISEDGSHVYFLANGVLTTTPNGEGETAEAGADNLYAFERDARDPAGQLAFVAQLSEGDLRLSRSRSGHVPGGDVTPDGQFFVFASERDLTPDTTSHGVSQIFDYDAQTGDLIRVSIGQDGYNHDGNVAPIYRCCGELYNNLDNATIAEPIYGGAQSSAQGYWHGASVSANGAYVFFQSAVGLTPQALDRKIVGVENENEPEDDYKPPIYAANIYEYHDGRVSLISDGQDLSHNVALSSVTLSGTDESGGDVFFSTGDSLVPQDTDDNVDIYDARVDGGFPSPVTSSCAGEECQGALSGAPTLLSPGSELQAGGNPPLAGEPAVKAKAKAKAKAKKCPKGRHLARGKCVKSKKANAKKASINRRAK
jgi:hypothetical protein